MLNYSLRSTGSLDDRSENTNQLFHISKFYADVQIDDIGFLKQSKPVSGFPRLFRRNGHFRNEISSTLSCLRLLNLSTNTRTRSQELVGDDELPLLLEFS